MSRPGDTAEHTVTFVGSDLRKVDAHDARVLDADGNDIGTVLTCATDIAVGRVGGKIYSIASPDKPENFKAKGLCCGYVKVKKSLSVGETITLQDKKTQADGQCCSGCPAGSYGPQTVENIYVK